MITVSISMAQHDASICILKDEEVLLYFQEERLSRIKKDASQPFKFLELIPKYTDTIDKLVLLNFPYSEFNSDIHDLFDNFNLLCDEIKNIVTFIRKNDIYVCSAIVNYDSHHLYHAASAFYGSGFENAICLVIDGWGAHFPVKEYIEDYNLFAPPDHYETDFTGAETTSAYYFQYPCQVELLYKNLYIKPKLLDSVYFNDELNPKFELSHSLDVGVSYGTFTEYLGFNREDGGKTMGLSSYGKENSDLPEIFYKDTIYTDRNLLLGNRTINKKLFPELKYDKEDFQKKADIAYKVQKYLEKVFIYRITQCLELKPDCNNIVLSGGCALNILGNSLIKKQFPNINFFVDPVSNDACQAYGGAKYYYHMETQSRKKSPLTTLYLGPKYKSSYMKKLVELEVLEYNSISEDR